MISVSINEINICKEFNVTLESFEIGMPEAKLIKVQIPGRDGELDMSEALSGYINYGNREITLKIGITGDDEISEEKKQKVLMLAAGKKAKLEFSHLDGYFYGRCTPLSLSREFAHHTLTLSFSCDPYRYQNDETVEIRAITDTPINIICVNSIMPVSPVIETSEEATIEFKDKTFHVEKGVHRLGIVFREGNNILKVKGDGAIKVRYRRGEM